MKKHLKILSIVLVCLLLVGCNIDNTFDEGDFKISVGTELKKDSEFNYLYAYKAYATKILVNKESIDDLKEYGINEDSTISDYMELVKKTNGIDSRIYSRNNYAYVIYSDDSENYYLVATYKGKDAFWIVNFICTKDTVSNYKDKFLNWADSVEV